MSKIYAILYAIVLFFATIARVFECFFEAILESRGISLSFFVEVYANHWSDPRYYTPVSVHWGRVVSLWKGVLEG